MSDRTEVCECCDYETPTAEMTVWRSPIVTRVLIAPEARNAAVAGPDAWRSGLFLYRREILERRVCVWCADRLAHGKAFGEIGRNRLKLGLVISLAVAAVGVAAFPALQPLLTSAFWQEPEENGRRSLAAVVGPRSYAPGDRRSSSTLSFPR